MKIGLVTSARSDFGYYIPLLDAFNDDLHIDVQIIATGMHLSSEFGHTVDHLEDLGFRVEHRVPSHVIEDSPQGITAAMGKAVSGFGELFSTNPLDLLVILGDRYDMFPAAVAALPHRIPVAHIAGGEITEGAIDDSLRHSMTKLSHLHFVSTNEYARRVKQMGEEMWRITVSGALSLDNLRMFKLDSAKQTVGKFGLDYSRPIVLVTYHPVTLEYDQASNQIQQLLLALDGINAQYIITYPNSDTGSSPIVSAINNFCGQKEDRYLIMNAGQRQYFSLMNACSAMVGNSSSGIVEASSFSLPVVNVGTRQRGRIQAGNVIDCKNDADSIKSAVTKALDRGFQKSIQDMENPYGDGFAAKRIMGKIKKLDDYPDLIRKRFISEKYSTPIR